MTEEVKTETQEVKTEEKKVETPEYSEIETSALDEGWKPKDQWEGDPDEWVSAKAWKKRGEFIAEIDRVKKEKQNVERVFQSLKTHHVQLRDALEKKYQDQLMELKLQKREALKEEDHSKALALADDIDTIREQREREIGNLNAKIAETNIPVETAPDPVFVEWQKQNTWYSLDGKDKVSQTANKLALAYIAEHGKPSSPTEYKRILNEIKEEMKELFPSKFENPNRDRASAVNDTGSVKGTSSKSVKLSSDQESAFKEFEKMGVKMTKEEYLRDIQEWENRHG